MNDNRRGAGTWAALIVLLGIYFAFILTIAFAPGIFGRPVADGMAMSIGFPVGTAIIVGCMIIAWIYTAVKNRADAARSAPPS